MSFYGQDKEHKSTIGDNPNFDKDFKRQKKYEEIDADDIILNLQQ